MKIAIIPARGGSKRILRKNIKNFCGKPMIAWSIEAAKASRLFHRIIVSTDDAEIADVAKRWDAEVPFMRPAELSDDHTGTTAVIAHAIRWLHDHGEKPSAVCCIYATAPFVRAGDIQIALAKLESGAWEYVFSATTFEYPIFRAIEQAADGKVRMFFPEHFLSRSQDLPEAIHDAGQFYWGLPEAWLENKQIFDQWASVVLIPRWRVQDIDTLEDWERAERLAKLLNEDRDN
jgi:N-acylneuraminate cytidylyltransferase